MRLPVPEGKPINCPRTQLKYSTSPHGGTEKRKYQISVADSVSYINFVFSIFEPVIRLADWTSTCFELRESSYLRVYGLHTSNIVFLWCSDGKFKYYLRMLRYLFRHLLKYPPSFIISYYSQTTGGEAEVTRIFPWETKSFKYRASRFKLKFLSSCLSHILIAD